jgi:exonuclease I
MPNNNGILIWDLPNDIKDYILRNLDNDTFRKIFTKIADDALNISRI